MIIMTNFLEIRR